MADHLQTETDVPELQQKLADYYRNGMHPAEAHQTAAVPRRDLHPAVAEVLGIDASKALNTEQVAHLLTGLRADGEAVPGKQVQNTTNRARIAYVDLCLSAPKSFSVALAFAPTEAERAILDRAHRDAVDSTIAHIASHIGVARKGKGGKKGSEEGHVAWVQFDHFTARPTIKIARDENGVQATELVTVKVAGDPQRHTHVVIPNVVVTDSGRVGGLDLQRIKSRVHEYGAIYQAYLATNLRRSGVEVELDSDPGKSLTQKMGRLVSVPRWATELFSKRTSDGEEAARAYAAAAGADWDRLGPDAKAKFLKGGTAKARQSKQDDLADYQAWQRQAEDAGYQHRSVLRPGEEQEPGPARERLEAAYQASLPLLDLEMQRRSTFEGSLARLAAAKSLIGAGMADPAEINAITAAYRTEGVQQDGKMTNLLWGRGGESQFASFTTGLHVAQEEEAIGLLRTAAADHSSALSPDAIERAVQKVVAEKGYDFTSDHGRLQRRMIEQLGTAGRAVVGTGVAGSGKTTLLESLVEAWHADGRRTIGVTLAWRQSHALAEAGVGRQRKRGMKMQADTRQLTDAGIPQPDAFALAYFLAQAERGRIKLDDKTVVVVDEIAQVGTRQVLHLARLQAKHGFQIVGLGDDKQCQSIEAGATIRLFQKALGTEQVPELLNTVRQMAERDRETSLLFRDGRAAEALARKDEDGTLQIVAGGYRQAIEAGVSKWAELRAASGHDVVITVPTNADARAVGEVVREQRRAAGEVGPDEVRVQAIDQQKSQYELAIARGDRLRLFARVGSRSGNGGVFGDNGSVVEVLEVHPGSGLTLRNAKGREGVVSWGSLRDKETGRIMLTYGDALTIDARQGDTVTEHVTIMPGGSAAVNAFKAYTAESRHRLRSWIYTSQGEELQEIFARRPMGDPRNQVNDPAQVRASIIENMARNLSRQPLKELGTDFLARARDVRTGAIRGMQAAWHRAEAALITYPRRRQQQQEAQELAPVVAAVSAQVQAVQAATAALTAAPAAPKHTTAPQAAQARAKEAPMSPAELQAEFADALRNHGMQISGAPIMDGRWHRVAVDGDRKGKRSGSYKGWLDGAPGGVINNFKGGEPATWRPSRGATAISTADRERMRREDAAARAERQKERQQREERTAKVAQAVWSDAAPADHRHPYLVSKGIGPGALRQALPGQAVPLGDGRKMSVAGRLLVPLRDIEGQMWNLQLIDRDGGKLFLPGGRMSGLFAVVGTERPDADRPLLIAEGYATAATLHSTTALTTVAALNSGNLLPVATALRARNPNLPMIVAADNDHHLPRRDKPLPNVGVEKGREAALAAGGETIIPQFGPQDRGTDWNDYAAQHGRDGVRAAVGAALGQLGFPPLPPEPPQVRQSVSQAERDAARATRSAVQSAPRRPLTARAPTARVRPPRPGT